MVAEPSDGSVPALLMEAGRFSVARDWAHAAGYLAAVDALLSGTRNVDRVVLVRLVACYDAAGWSAAAAAARGRLALVGLPDGEMALGAARHANADGRWREAIALTQCALAQEPDADSAFDLLTESALREDMPEAVLDAVARSSRPDMRLAAVSEWLTKLAMAGESGRKRAVGLFLASRAALGHNRSAEQLARFAAELGLTAAIGAYGLLARASLLVPDGLEHHGSGGAGFAAVAALTPAGIAALGDDLVVIAPKGVDGADKAAQVLHCLAEGYGAACDADGLIGLRRTDMQMIALAANDADDLFAAVADRIARIARIAWVEPVDDLPFFDPATCGPVFCGVPFEACGAVCRLQQAGLEVEALPDAPDGLRALVWDRTPSAIVVPESRRQEIEQSLAGLRVAVLTDAEVAQADATTVLGLIGARRDPVLVAVGSGIGNMIQTTPLIAALATGLGRPVDVLMREDFPGCAAIFQGSAKVDRIVTDEIGTARQAYVLVVTTHFFGLDPPSVAAARVVNARDHGSAAALRNCAEVDLNLQLLPVLGLALPQPGEAAQFIGATRRDAMVGYGGARRIGIHAGSKGGKWEAKRWPHFAELAAHLVAAGHEVVSFGSADEAVPGTLDRTGLSLAQTFAEMVGCSGFVANDSGLMHAADALDVPLVAIFAPTSVVKNGPVSRRASVVQVGKECSPCQFDALRLATCRCIAEIPVAAVLEAVQGLFDGGTGQPLPPALAHKTVALMTQVEFDAEEARVRALLADPSALGRLTTRRVREAIRHAPLLGLAPEAAALLEATAWDETAVMLRRHPASATALIEAAAFAVDGAALRPMIDRCIRFAVKQPMSALLLNLLRLLQDHCGAHAAQSVLRNLQRDRLPLLLARAPISAIAGGNLPVLADKRALELRVLAALVGGNRPAFIAALNVCLMTGCRVDALIRLLRNSTQEVADLRLDPAELLADLGRGSCLATILFPGRAACRSGGGDEAIMDSAARGDLGPLNHWLTEQLAGLTPVTLRGGSLRAVLASALEALPEVGHADHGMATIIMSARDPQPDLFDLALRSVLVQTYRNLEVLVIDDNSVVPVASLLPEDLRDHPALRVVRLTQQVGTYVCRNIGLQQARGAWIGFHDCDDVAHPQRVELQIDRLVANPQLGVCYVGHMRFDACGRIQPELDGKMVGDGPVTSIFRRELFDRVGVFAPVRSRGDIEMRERIEALCGAEVIGYSRMPLLFCAGGQTLSARTQLAFAAPLALFRRAFRERIRIIDERSGSVLKLGHLAIPVAMGLQATV